MTQHHRSPWRGWLLVLAVGLLLLVGRAAASGNGQPPSPLACPAGEVTWLAGTASPGSALLVRFADAVVGGGSAGSDGRWRIPLSVEASVGIYPVTVAEREGGTLIATFTCYVGVPVGATPTGTPTRRPTERPTATHPSATVTPQPSSASTTPSTMALSATTSETTALPPSTTPGAPTPMATYIPPPPTATIATSTPTSTAVPTGEALVALVAAQADEPGDSELYEYIIVENQSLQPQALSGWRLAHQATGEAYPFPDVTLLPGEQLVVWSGAGEDDLSTGTFYWPTTAGHWAVGDIAELFDASGHVVSSLVMPPPDEAEE